MDETVIMTVPPQPVALGEPAAAEGISINVPGSGVFVCSFDVGEELTITEYKSLESPTLGAPTPPRRDVTGSVCHGWSKSAIRMRMWYFKGVRPYLFEPRRGVLARVGFVAARSRLGRTCTWRSSLD